MDHVRAFAREIIGPVKADGELIELPRSRTMAGSDIPALPSRRDPRRSSVHGLNRPHAQRLRRLRVRNVSTTNKLDCDGSRRPVAVSDGELDTAGSELILEGRAQALMRLHRSADANRGNGK